MEPNVMRKLIDLTESTGDPALLARKKIRQLGVEHGFDVLYPARTKNGFNFKLAYSKDDSAKDSWQAKLDRAVSIVQQTFPNAKGKMVHVRDNRGMLGWTPVIHIPQSDYE